MCYEWVCCFPLPVLTCHLSWPGQQTDTDIRLHLITPLQNKINPGALNIRRIGWKDTDFDLDEIELDDFWQESLTVRM
jgi:hypothetical protein